MRYYWWQEEEKQKKPNQMLLTDNNYLLPEHITSNGVDITTYLINEINRLKRVIAQHQKKAQEYEQELNKILAE